MNPIIDNVSFRRQVESFDSRDLLGGYGNTLRPTVAKSYSFGGYTATCTSHEANAAAMRGGETAVNGAPGVYHNVNTQHQGGQNYGTRFLSKQVRSSEVGYIDNRLFSRLDY